jgi:hypothetical protein
MISVGSSNVGWEEGTEGRERATNLVVDNFFFLEVGPERRQAQLNQKLLYRINLRDESHAEVRTTTLYLAFGTPRADRRHSCRSLAFAQYLRHFSIVVEIRGGRNRR